MNFARPERRQRGIELTPLIDVVFLLLVFLILTANFQHPSLELDLPRGQADEASAERTVLLELTADGALALDGSAVARENLSDALAVALRPLERKAVRLRADERAPYGLVLPVIDLARAAGAEAVDLVHEGGA